MIASCCCLLASASSKPENDKEYKKGAEGRKVSLVMSKYVINAPWYEPGYLLSGRM